MRILHTKKKFVFITVITFLHFFCFSEQKINIEKLYGKFTYSEYYPIDSENNESIGKRLEFLNQFDDWHGIFCNI